MNFAEHLKSQLDIVEVIEQYVRLKRSGVSGRYVGLCPFHSEKTPSFGVNSTLQYYKCFGCEAGGDVFKFVMQIESLTFPEALKLLAERYSVPIPVRQRFDDPEAQFRQALFEMQEIAAELFQSNLRSSVGSEARRYLQSRGVSQAALDEFRLGLSDASGQQLTQRLQRFGPALIEESGLAKKRADGSGFYDTFRGRLMFPIHTESGKVVAFGGRALRPQDEPKYLNSPETKIYKKSSLLFNLHRAKIEARKQERLILVEGYMDAIGIYANGVQEVAAICGTALGHEQVRTIKRQISHIGGRGEVILNLDPDAAGSRSVEKHIGVLLSEGLRVKVMSLPDGLDPDEFIQAKGAEAYKELLDGAFSYFHWLAERAREKFDTTTAEGRVDAFKFLKPAIQQVRDKFEREAIVQELAERLKIDRDLIREQLRRAPPEQTTGNSVHRSVALPPNEKLLLSCFLLSEEARTAIKSYFFEKRALEVLELRPIFETALAMENDGVPFSIHALQERLEPRLQRMVADLSFSDLGIRDTDALQLALDSLRVSELKALEAVRAELKQKIRAMEQAGNIEEAMRLISELNQTENAPPMV